MKRSVVIPIPKKGNAKECSNYPTIAFISHASKVMLKIPQARLQQYMNWELPDVQAQFIKGKETRDQIANICWIIEKAREFQKNIYFCCGSDGKASACRAGDPGSIPGLGRSPGEGNGNPLQYSCLENSMDWGAWWATVHGVAKSRTRLSNFTFTFQAILELSTGHGLVGNEADESVLQSVAINLQTYCPQGDRWKAFMERREFR